jgi:tRNA/rRNA methyltransferase
MNTKSLLSNVTIVLVRPKKEENIGAAARIAFNMGIEKLVVVSDTPHAYEPMAKMATHKAVHLIDNLVVYPSLKEAVTDYSFIVGTTARSGRQRYVEKTPREIVETLLPMLPDNKVAILFGPEDTGLTNDDLKFCRIASSIPTAEFSSINLAQAVAIHCYELYFGITHTNKKQALIPQLASSHELESMYANIEAFLYSFDFLNQANHSYWMTNIRRFFNKKFLTSKDANVVRTVCKKFLLHQKGEQSTNPGAS